MNPLSGIGLFFSGVVFLGTLFYLLTMSIDIASATQPVTVTFLKHEVTHFVWGALATGWMWMILGAMFD